MRNALMICALLAAACGGGNDRPAQDPSSSASSATLTNAPATAAPTPDSSASPSGLGTASSAQSSLAATPPSSDSSVAPANTTGPSATSDTSTPAFDNAGTQGRAESADTTKPDNTKVNDRDRHGTRTPMNQGNSDGEVKITAAIRRGLMGDKSLSFTAKNVKVITVGSKVTLRGPVKSEDEKRTIEAVARQTPGVTDVDDEIEVKK